MSECARCGGAFEGARVTLRNVGFNNGVVSMLRSRMVVCAPCHERMQESDDWDV